MSSVKPVLERTITIAVDPRSNQISQQDPRSKAIIFLRCLKREDRSGENDYDRFRSKIQDLTARSKIKAFHITPPLSQSRRYVYKFSSLSFKRLLTPQVSGGFVVNMSWGSNFKISLLSTNTFVTAYTTNYK